MQFLNQSSNEIAEGSSQLTEEMLVQWQNVSTVLYNSDSDLRKLHHDLRACIRTFSYLKSSIEKTLLDNATDRRKMQLLEENMLFLNKIQELLLEKIFPLEASSKTRPQTKGLLSDN